MNNWEEIFTTEKIKYFKDLAKEVTDAKSYIDEFYHNGIDLSGIEYFINRLNVKERYDIYKQVVEQTIKNHGDQTALPILRKIFKMNEKTEADIISDAMFPNVDWRNIHTLVDQNSYVLSKLLTKVPIATDQEFEDIVFKNPYYAYIYARDIIKGRFPAVEDIIATDVRISFEYALNVLKGPFPKGEDIIAKDPLYAAKYAIDAKKGSFPEGEKAIAMCPDALLIEEYAKYCKRDRFPEGEAKIIERDSFVLKWYIEFLKKIEKYDEFIKDHPEVEKMDLTTQEMPTLDTHIPNIDEILVEKDKAKEALEKYIKEGNKKLASFLIPIAKDPWLTFKYAEQFKEKVKDEWEDIISKDALSSETYAENILRSPFPKGEDAIATDGYSSAEYAYRVLKGPFPKGEDAIIRDSYSFGYAKFALKDRFIKGEDEIIKDKDLLIKYINFLKYINKLDDFYKDHPEAKINISSGQIDILYNIYKQSSLDEDLLFKSLFSKRGNMNIKLNDFLNSLFIEKISKYFDAKYSSGKIERMGIGRRDGEAWVIQNFDIDEFESDPEIKKILKDDKLDDDKKLEKIKERILSIYDDKEPVIKETDWDKPKWDEMDLSKWVDEKIKEIEEEKENSKNIELEELFSKPKISIEATEFSNIFDDFFNIIKHAKADQKRLSPEAEKEIAKRPYYSVLYAEKALNDRFKEGEPGILKNPEELKKYTDFLDSIGKLDDFYKDHPEARVTVKSNQKMSIKAETLYVSDDNSEVKKPSDLNVTDDANAPEEVKTKEGKTYKKVQK
jgi:lambda repressor-like predicted transcriptional regulator